MHSKDTLRRTGQNTLNSSTFHYLFVICVGRECVFVLFARKVLLKGKMCVFLTFYLRTFFYKD